MAKRQLIKARDYAGTPKHPADKRMRTHNGHTQSISVQFLPKSHKKYRPAPGSARFSKASTCSNVTRMLDDTVEGPNIRDVTELRRTNNGLERVKTEKFWTPKKPVPKGF